MRSTVTHTLKLLKDMGAEAVVLEKWVTIPKHPAGGIRRDAWGADVLAVQGRLGMAIQSTSAAGRSKHIKAALSNPDLHNWFRMGVAFYIYSWKKGGPRNEWLPRVDQLVVNDNGKVVVL